MATPTQVPAKMLAPSTAQPASPRFVFIDGLRGVAALAVLLYHYHLLMVDWPVKALIPAPLHWLLGQGFLGVEIFFVISGFVIAHSLRKVSATWRFIGWFAVRRSLRLDPPYLTVVFFIVACSLLAPHFGIKWESPISLRVILANVFYLQDILRDPSILVVAWTLCLEVQFYLLCVLLLHFTQKAGAEFVPPTTAYIVAVTAIISTILNAWGDVLPGWFVAYWYMFAGGLLAYWTWKEVLPAPIYGGYLMVLIGLWLWRRDAKPLAVAVCSLLIYVAGIRGQLTSWLGGRVWQWLGRISYSLYLTHAVFLYQLFKYGHRLTGSSAMGSLVCVLLLLPLSLAIAQAMYFLVERPSHQLSARMRSIHFTSR